MLQITTVRLVQEDLPTFVTKIQPISKIDAIIVGYVLIQMFMSSPSLILA